MRVFVMARAQRAKAEHAFIGEEPPSAWWRAYSGLSEPEVPTLIVEAADTGWRSFASAIPLHRRETGGRELRLTFVAEGAFEDEAASEPILRLIALWLTDRHELARRLEAEFPDAVVTPSDAPEYAEDIRARVERVLSALPSAAPGQPVAGPWFAASDSPAAAGPFLGACWEVMAGRGKLAALLNTAGPDDLSQLLGDGDVAVLLEIGPAEPTSIPGLVVEPDPPGKALGQGTTWKQTLARWEVRAAGAVLLVVIAGVIVLLTI